MGYCFNPTCSNPENLADNDCCQSCGSKLSILRDRYRVIKALAQGGFGATFLAHDEGLPGHPHCVIKQLRPSTKEPHILHMARNLFEREAQTLGKIGSHPQIPRLLDYFEENQQFYLVQEYVNGWTLHQEIKRCGPISEAGVKQFLSEMLPIIKYIHQNRVIHRDIKPANIIRRSVDCKLVLIDFGAVKNQVNQIGANQAEHSVLTAYAIGTPGFAPPEQIALRPVYGSDIYAVGVTCLYLLTGKLPKDLDFHPATGEILWQDKVEVSDRLALVLRKMLDVSVRHRYRSADEVLSTLELEPYMESLAKGMAVQKSLSEEERANGPRSADSSSHFSPQIVQVAAAIRARRTKPSDATSIQLGTVGYSMEQVKPFEKSTKDSTAFNSTNLIKAYAQGRRDFAQKNLSLLNLKQADLAQGNFHASKLDKTNLQGANLCHSDFGQAGLNRANLQGANLTKAYLSHADLEGADLRGADLSYAYLNKANLRGANLCGANLTGAMVSDEQLALAKTNWTTILPTGKRGFL